MESTHASTSAESSAARRTRALLQRVRDERRDQDPDRIRPRTAARAPLSFGQERLWLLHHLHPADRSYNLTRAWRLPLVDAPALERALAAIVERHDSLRTTFADANGTPCQTIAPFAGFALPTEDLASLDPDAQDAAIRARIAEAHAHRYELDVTPPFQARLLRCGAEDVLLLGMHHIITDGWSLGVLLRELSALYGAFRAGDTSPLTPLPVQYADFAVWQRDQLDDETRDAQRAYWRAQLRGAPALLALPTDRPRQAAPSGRGASEHFTLPPDLVARLRAVAHEANATPFMAFAALFQLLLGRYCGSDDVVIGSPTAGRTRRETEPLIGFFVNTIVLRANLSGDPTVRELLVRARDVTLGAFEHQDLPFERIVADLGTERSLSHAPIFQVLFSMDDGSQSGSERGALQARPLSMETTTSPFDLALVLSEDGSAGTVTYSTDLFEQDTIRRFVRHFATLVEQAATQPSAPISSLTLLDEHERAQVVETWNQRPAFVAARADSAPAVSVTELIDAQLTRTPAAIAVRDEAGAALTFAALNARANQVARHLVTLGVGPDVRVAVGLERRIDLLVALLAVWKAGGAYVPLDPRYPASRIAFMLADAGARVLLTQSSLRDVWPDAPNAPNASNALDTLDAPDAAADGPAAAGAREVPGVTVVCLDDEEVRGAVARRADANLPTRAHADGLAYVIYTSGSTGVPKGVAIAHRSVLAFLAWAATAFSEEERAGLLASTSICFDLSVFELFLPLAYGGCVLLATDVATLPTSPLAPDVRLLNTVPSAAAALLAGDGLPPGVRTVALAGEALRAPLVDALLGSGVARVCDLYGPSEDTTYSTCAARTLHGPETIGRPIAGTQAYVLDAAGLPVPIGIPGELWLGGAGLARGYLHRPGLTAARFRPDPFGQSGGRLYRTGDRVRLQADGTLEYLGRLDGQVKLRGFRIELGEIEAALRAQTSVTDAAVLVREDRPGEPRLIAYVVGSACVDDVRAQLRGRLPDYMVPAAIVPLDALPRTPNGKLDRQALPAPEFADAAEYVAPRAPAEETLAAIWSDLLRVPRVSVRANFFTLGGDSILAMQMVSRARRAGFTLSPRQVFEAQTIAELAAVAGRASAPRDESALGSEPESDGGAPLTPIQSWFFEQRQPAPWHFNQSMLLAIDPAIDDDAIAQALHATLAHHEALRLRFRSGADRSGADRAGADGWEQWHAADSGIVLERVDLSSLPPAEQETQRTAIAEARQASLDLAEGPLGRAVLFNHGEDNRLLLLIFHHLVIDGVSWRILRDDLLRACDNIARGAPIDLGVKSSSHRTWARSLQAFAASPALARELPYWQRQGDGDDPLASATRREESRPNGPLALEVATVSLSEAETRQLLQNAPEAYRTRINDLLLCALVDAIEATIGSPRVRVAFEGHGREEEAIDPRLDLSRTIGWFTTIHPVTLERGDAGSIGDRIKTIKEQLRVVPANGIGYGLLRYLSPDPRVRAALASQPDPAVVFNYLGRIDEAPGGHAGAAERPEPLRFVHHRRGAEWAAVNRRRHALEVNAAVRGGCLHVHWIGSDARFRQSMLTRLSEAFMHALRGCVAHCLLLDAGGATPSDFPLAPLAQADLDRVVGARRDVEDLYPLSPLQEGLLFHALQAESTQAYQVQVTQRLEGPLDASRFQRAWADIVVRHAALRTAFVWDGVPRPLQRVDAAAALPWRIEDWSGRDAAAQQEALARHLADDRARGFALDRPPLMRCALFRLGPRSHWFVCSVHHLVLDGWSLSRIFRDAYTLYEALADERPAALSQPRPYRDHIAWLQRQDPSAAERYWRQTLDGIAAATPLGVDRPATPGLEPRYAKEALQLSDEQTARLEALARRSQVTLGTIVLGAWGLLLSRYCGQDDVVFGATVSGRSSALEGVEEMIGLFINTLPVRLRVPVDEPVDAWLAALQRQQAEGREYEYAALPDVRRWSGLPAGQPMFESHVIFENYPVARRGAAADAARLQVVESEGVEWTTYPLSIMAAPGARLALGASYDETRFDADTVARLLRHLARVLDQMAAAPGARLAAIDPLDEDERACVVRTWNATKSSYPAEQCLHELIEAQVARTPAAMAVRFEERVLTYAALNARANQVARALVARGVGPDVRVGVCLPRGLELMVALLGVLKAGGAYVPLDPGYPGERLAGMLEDAAAPVLIVDAAWAAASAWRVPDGTEVVRVPPVTESGDGSGDIGADAANLPLRAAPDNLAYVIFTSGSTGRPKGAMNAHAAIVNRLCWMQARYALDPTDVVLQKTPVSFDVSVWELFWPLMQGACLVLVRPDGHRDPSYLQALVAARGVTTLHFVPSMLPAFLDVATPANCASLRRVICSGEALPPSLVARVRTQLPPETRLENLYGPTEAAVDVSYWRCAAEDAQSSSVPIGRPVWNTQLYVLDAAMQPTPIGVAGELYIGGVQVARGYVRRPGLTAARFVPDPFGSPGARLYRTGDRARWRADGAIDYLGRLDAQVKLRGFRIELGEIETVIQSLPDVSAATVLAREDTPGVPRLVAYIAGTAAIDQVREALRRQLPDYMVPSAFVTLAALPLTPNGKIDRRALPAPDFAETTTFVAPRTATERTLARIWSDVLRLDQVGVSGNFFELGGDSILAIQVVSRARREGLALSPRLLFLHPTIEQLAPEIERRAAEAISAAQSRSQARADGAGAGASTPTPIQSWFFEQALPAAAHFNQSALFAVPEAASNAVIDATLQAVLAHHEAFRLRVRLRDGLREDERPDERQDGPSAEIRYADSAGVVLERHDLSNRSPEEQRRVQTAHADRAQASLDLTNGPLARALLFDLGPHGRHLLLILHHLIVDGVSWRILRDDLSRACGQLMTGEPIDLGPTSSTWRAWAAALVTRAADSSVREELAFWQAQGEVSTGRVPVDGPRTRTEAETRVVTVRLDAEETRALLQDVPAVYRTQINDVLLCAVASAVEPWTGSALLRVALEGHGRDESIAPALDLTRTVGWFTSLYPVTLDLTGATASGDRLKRVKEQLRAVPAQGIGYGLLRYLCPDAAVRAALAAQEEPEICFNYLGRFDAAGEAAGDAEGDTVDSAGGTARTSGEWTFVSGPQGRGAAEENPRRFLIDVSGAVQDGCLSMHWAYGSRTYDEAAIRRVAERFGAALRALIAHCRSAAPGATPSDFPLAAITQSALDQLIAAQGPIEDLYPLSPMQEGLLFHALAEEGPQPYQVQGALRLEGALDAVRLQQAWDDVVRRHAALRTGFIWPGEPRPLQYVRATVDTPWLVEDWRDRPASSHETMLDAYLAADRARGFALERAPLLRIALFRVDAAAHWLVWNVHHLVIDGWSLSRVLADLFQAYQARVAGAPIAFARVRPYRDFIDWQRRQDGAACERYWRAALAGITAPTRLDIPTPPSASLPAPATAPGLAPAPATVSAATSTTGAGTAEAPRAPRAETIESRLPAAETQALERLARQAQVTLSTVLLGAWGLLLARYAGEADVVVGQTVAGRPAGLDGADDLVGLCINTLPVRLSARGAALVHAWLGDLQRAQAEAREFEQASLLDVQRWSEIPAGTPLFESSIVFENYPVARSGPAAGGLPLRVTGRRVQEEGTFPLSLIVAPGESLGLQLAFDARRFDAAAIGRLAAHLRTLLMQMANAGADARLSSLTLVDAAERACVVETWNQTARAYSRDETLAARFREQAAARPEVDALIWGDARWSYASLDRETNQLAHLLRTHGVAPECRVGLLLPRGPALLQAVLAVVKAGGAYVPLEPTAPPARLARTCADAGLTVLLTTRALRDRVADDAAAAVLCLEDLAAALAALPTTAPAALAYPDTLAYIVYTSGSTGEPKGVMVAHRHVVQLICETNYVRLGPGDRMAQASNAAFDALTFELWGAWLTGATLVGVPPDVLLDPAAFAALLRAERITTLYQTTALLNGLVRDRADLFASVREVLFGGQAADAASVRRLLAAGGPQRLLHMYGPTETTAWCSWATIDAVPAHARTVSIGHPTGNARIYLLDPDGQPVPRGVAGEAYVGGDGVVRGYLGRPGLTAARFVPDPFGPPGARLYRTGDRLRREADGSLDYVGRLDAPVKIRGFRIEPGEIEQALVTHPAIREARVLARTVHDEPRLVAYIVCTPQLADVNEEVEADVRAHLARLLPDYMVPSAIVSLAHLPLTPNGKLDVAALPEPVFVETDDYTAPRTPMEEILCGIWADVLNVPRVGIQDNFFALGGHSLLAMRVTSRLRDALAIELPIRTLFDAPTVRALAAQALAAQSSGAAAAPSIVPRVGKGPAPLSFAQERLWFLDRLEPDRARYNVPIAQWLDGPLDVAALTRAFADVVRRHDVLRTTFHTVDGVPIQIVTPADSDTATGALAAPDADACVDVRERLAEEAARPFDLSRGPLIRATLLRVSDTRHALLLVLHHSVTDAWSLGLLFRELAARYEAHRAGDAAPIAPLPLQYADYAVWQRERARGPAFDAQIGYWRTQLAGAPPLITLPTDRPRPPLQSVTGARESVDLPADLLPRLRELARREGVTLYMIVLAAFQALLGRYASTDDVIVGSPIAGRPARELESVIGLFVNTLVLRTDLSGDPTLGDLLRRVRRVTLDAYAHQDVPFEKLVDVLQAPRSLAHAPLFQVLFTLQEDDGPLDELTGITRQPIAIETRSTKCDLELDVTVAGDRLLAGLTYATALFDRETAARMLRQLSRLLARMASDSSVACAAVDLLDEEERAQVVAGSNRTPAIEADEETVPALVEAQVRREPAAIAVRDEAGTVLTFALLNARANQLARHLVALGVGPDVCVAVGLERRAELIVALLAIMKAGGAYVPLDPRYPAARLAFMLGDARARVLITQESLRAALPVPAGVTVVCLDEPRTRDTVACLDAGPLAARARAENLAYVIYTSGSTGVPKGVAIAHRSAVALLAWAATVFDEEKRGGLLASTSICFDLSIFEIFLPLAYGGCVLLVADALALPGSRLAPYVRLLNTVPSAAAALLASDGIPPSVRTVALAGEPLRAPLVDALLAQGASRVCDLYGPSEDTTYSTWVTRRANGPETIGRPIAGTQAYVLDAAGAPVPIGLPGELWLGGAGLARGYLHRPGLTADRFRPDPFGPAGARLYRTGDRVRWRPDGTLEYLGRLDAQIKLRGFRIELGEIDAALRALEGVREAAVIVREDRPGDPRLTAYIVGRADVDEIRTELRGRLPDYMLPAAVVTLDALPRTPNGKLDRRALPEPALDDEQTHAAPRTPIEETLCAIWEEVLRRPRLGVTGDFFAHGGHSLLAMRVVARVQQAFGVDIPVSALFESPTIAELAAMIDARRNGGSAASDPIVPLHAAAQAAVPHGTPHETPQGKPTDTTHDATHSAMHAVAHAGAPLSFAQERLWFLDHLDTEREAYAVRLALRLTGPLRVDALERALADIVRRHDLLRTTFVIGPDGAPIQRVAPFDSGPLQLRDLSTLDVIAREEAARDLLAEEAHTPFDLASGPPLRTILLRLAEDEHIFLLSMHHIVCDEWSLGLLFSELSTGYAAHAQGADRPAPPVPAPLPVQYADYAAWQRARLTDERLAETLDYWRRQLAEAPPLLALPTDHPRPPVLSAAGARESLALSSTLIDRLRTVGRGEGATLYMVALAAFQLLLARHAATNDIVVGTPMAGRTRPEIEPLIGCFLETRVLRTDLSGDPTFAELLRRVRRVTLDAHTHRDLPFERIVDALQPARSLGHAPLFQVLFTQQDGDTIPPRLGDLRLQPIAPPRVTAKFDLALDLLTAVEGGAVGLIYSTDLFERGTALRLLKQYARLLAQVVETPDARLSTFTLLDEAERTQVLRGWNQEAAIPAEASTLPALIALQVARTPAAIAVRDDEGGTVTFAALEARANRLARHLVSLGVGPEVRVAVGLDRRVELVVALLAVLKAGGAYVPLDARYPAARLRFMMADAGARVLVTQEALRASLPDVPGMTVVSLDAPATREALARQSDDGLDERAHADALAYVIYTSGSTGVPKGVAIAHRSAVALLAWAATMFPAEERAGLLASTSICFDLSVFELFLPLAYGGCVLMVADALALQTSPLAADVRLLNTVPSAAAALLASDGLPSGVRTVALAGEPLRPALVDALLARGVPRVCDLYGPSEDTTYSTCATRERHGAETIGRPIAGTQAYVLDAGGAPVPIGVPGELWLGGAGLARGYLDRPGLTADRFRPDPFGPASASGGDAAGDASGDAAGDTSGGAAGGRLYRTGDRVRWRVDGTLEYLGRFDAQIKLHGFRIELGEIEAALRDLPGVTEAVALVRAESADRPRLVAWIVGSIEPAAARAALRARLPEHMVPSVIVPLDALPRTPNGKLDRQALPAPAARTTGEAMAPRTAMEARVAEMWCGLLGVDAVGVRDTFFDLGGSSLLLTRLLVQLRTIRADLRMVDLFHHTTVEAMAAHLGAAVTSVDALALAESRERAVVRRAAPRRSRAVR